MTVKLIAKTEGAYDLIAYCARVSNPANQDNKLTQEKLLKYCIDKKHWSIFEMVNVVMEIKTTRTIARQILRHRSFSFQEFSQRYAEVQGEMVFTDPRLQDPKNRQASIDSDDYRLNQDWKYMQISVADAAETAYEWAISKGIAKEVARNVLPEGMTPSVMYMNGSLRSWIHYCQLRMSNGTQLEHQQVAKECWNILLKEFPFLKEIE